ncbi:hypothetical protein DFH27DRAFT_3167 [Peziza echinospora]|nr:hypothetical protein DFH27DRAFT_3167 [Peziza echinospora]
MKSWPWKNCLLAGRASVLTSLFILPLVSWARVLPRPNGMHAFFFSFLAQCLHRMYHEEALRLRGSFGRGVRAERSGALTVPNGWRGVQSGTSSFRLEPMQIASAARPPRRCNPLMLLLYKAPTPPRTTHTRSYLSKKA